MSRLVLVTGTDTGVGKTTVSRGLLRRALRSGLAVDALKPIETGCVLGPDGQRLAADARALALAAGTDETLTCLYRFAAPAAPTVAAEMEGVAIDWDHLVRTIQERAIGEKKLLVEGAGGLLVPIARGKTFADLALEVGASVVIVSADRLGTINHTALTIEALARRSIPLEMVVLNRSTAADGAATPTDHMREFVRAFQSVRICGTVPHLPHATDDEIADALDAAGVPSPFADVLLPRRDR